MNLHEAIQFTLQTYAGTPRSIIVHHEPTATPSIEVFHLRGTGSELGLYQFEEVTLEDAPFQFQATGDSLPSRKRGHAMKTTP
jgi:hypothetical protein